MTRLAGVLLLALAPLVACGSSPARDSASPAAAAVETIDASALAKLMADQDIRLVDVRTPEEFAAGHIKGAVNMPVESFDPAQLASGDGRKTVLYCRSGRRSQVAADKLAATGKPATLLAGGILAWEAAGEPVER